MFSKINWDFIKLQWKMNWDVIKLLCNEKLYKYIFLYRIEESDSITMNLAPIIYQRQYLENEFNSYSGPMQ